MRLIDADALIESIKGLRIRDIQNMPTEVVFCKECRNRHTQRCGFYYKYEGKDGIEDYEWTYDDGFCSFGEWKIPEEIDEED